MGNSAVDLEAELNSRIETWSKLNVSGADSLKLSDLEARNLFGDGTSDFFEIDKKLLSVKLVDRQNVYEDGCVLDVSDSALTSKLEAVRTQSLPIFVIFPSGKKSNQQSARLGWLADENKAGKYLVLFGDVRPEYNPTAHFSDAMNALYQDQGGRAIIPESAKNKYWLDIVSNSVDENLNEFVVKNKSAPSFVPSVAEFLKVRNDKAYTVLCGSNNSGKSLLLKNMKFRSGYGCLVMAGIPQ